jgi:RNA polymerase sigma factor (sigma-70 family)
VQEQLRVAAAAFTERAERLRVQERLAALTPREREVLHLVIEGRSSQQIASRLGTSVKTVDVHRARIKAKTGAESLGTLVRDILAYRVPV